MKSRRSWLALMAGLACAATAHAQSSASEYPTHPVTIVVPFTVGGGSDSIARLVAARISARTGKTFIISNMGGAGTNIGNEFVARAQPDGYTYLLGQFTLSVNPYLYQHLQYKVEKDFVPVVHIADAPTVLTVSSKSPDKTAQALLERAKSTPNGLTYGSGGVGTPPHMSGELLRRLTGANLMHIPYKGSAPAIIDVISGRIDLDIDTASAVLPQIQGGQLRALAVASPHRIPQLPDVPTFAEVGVKGMEVPAWYGFLAPTGTPKAAVRWLNEQVNEVLKEAGFAERLQQMGAVAVGGSPEQFGQFMRAQSARWSATIKEANIKLD